MHAGGERRAVRGWVWSDFGRRRGRREVLRILARKSAAEGGKFGGERRIEGRWDKWTRRDKRSRRRRAACCRSGGIEGLTQWWAPSGVLL